MKWGRWYSLLTFAHTVVVNAAVPCFHTVIRTGAETSGQPLLSTAEFGAAPALTWWEDGEEETQQHTRLYGVENKG